MILLKGIGSGVDHLTFPTQECLARAPRVGKLLQASEFGLNQGSQKFREGGIRVSGRRCTKLSQIACHICCTRVVPEVQGDEKFKFGEKCGVFLVANYLSIFPRRNLSPGATLEHARLKICAKLHIFRFVHQKNCWELVANWKVNFRHIPLL